MSTAYVISFYFKIWLFSNRRYEESIRCNKDVLTFNETDRSMQEKESVIHVSVCIEKSFPRDHCLASLSKTCDAEELPSERFFYPYLTPMIRIALSNKGEVACRFVSRSCKQLMEKSREYHNK